MLGDQVLVDQSTQHGLVDQLDLGYLVRGAEAIEEVEKGNARLHSGQVGHDGEVLGLLRRPRGEEGETGLSHGHHVGVVAEDGEGVGRNRTRCDVDDRRGQLAGDLEHVRNHQEQALRCGEGGAQGTGGEGTMDGTCSPGLALHLDDIGNDTPEVRPLLV